MMAEPPHSGLGRGMREPFDHKADLGAHRGDVQDVALALQTHVREEERGEAHGALVGVTHQAIDGLLRGTRR